MVIPESSTTENTDGEGKPENSPWPGQALDPSPSFQEDDGDNNDDDPDSRVD